MKENIDKLKLVKLKTALQKVNLIQTTKWEKIFTKHLTNYFYSKYKRILKTQL